MRVALDTNVLAYAENVDTVQRRDKALAVLERLQRLPRADVVVPVQVLGELFNVLTLKAHRPRTSAREAILNWREVFSVVDTTVGVMVSASDLAAVHLLRIWDAVILSTASEAGCRLLLSEDFQDGFTWGGVTVTNPFAADRHPLLESLLAAGNESP